MHIVCAASLVLTVQLPSFLPHILAQQGWDGTDVKNMKNMHGRLGRCELLQHEVGDYCTPAEAQLLHIVYPCTFMLLLKYISVVGQATLG